MEERVAEVKNGENIIEGQYTPIQSVNNSHLLPNSILIVGLIAVSVRILYKESYVKAIGDSVSAVSLFIVAFGVCEIILRIYYGIFELKELHTKYSGDIEKVFAASNLNTLSWIAISLSFGLFLVLHISAGNTVESVWGFGLIACIPAFLTAIVACQIMGLKDSTLHTGRTISSMGGVDYGTGMAYSYFYGYLRIVLPSDGGENKGLRFKMEEWESQEKVSIPVKKLFILIPESGHIPPDLKEASYNWLEGTKSLESEVRDRAGVKRRSYKNTVYKIHPGGEGKDHRPVYVTTEGATPMLTFWEILKHAHSQTAAYREHRQQIIASFYKTLQTLLDNDPACGDVCELVYYKDKDANGKKVNVGEILLNRIRREAAVSV